MTSSAGNELRNVLASLAEANSNAAIKSIATSALSSIGYESWVFACDNPRSIFGMSHMMAGIPLQWVATYATKGYVKVDPILNHCRNCEDPLYWDATEGWEFAEKSEKEFMRGLHANGFGSGMAIPLRSTIGQVGILSIVSTQPLAEKRENYLQNFPSARTLGMAFHTAFDRIASK